jgi:hypothetical protein
MFNIKHKARVEEHKLRILFHEANKNPMKDHLFSIIYNSKYGIMIEDGEDST